MEYIRTRTYAACAAYGRLWQACYPLTARTLTSASVLEIPEAIWDELISLELIEVVHRTATAVHVRLIDRDARDVYHHSRPEYRGGRKC